MIPKVSILMPVYNRQETLGQSISSLVEQDFQEWELIAVDDGSTDASLSILQNWSSKDPRIQVFHQENADQLHALSRALKSRRGKWVCFLHSDDLFIDPSSLGRTYQNAEASQAQGVYAPLQLIDSEGNPCGQTECEKWHPSRNLLACFFFYASNPLNDVFFAQGKLVDQMAQHYLQDNTIYHLNWEQPLALAQVQPWYAYRIHPGQYAHTDAGLFGKYSGQFRTIFKLFQRGYAPPAYFHHTLFRKFARRLPFLRFWGLKSKQKDLSAARYYFQQWEKQLTQDYPGTPILHWIRQIVHSTTNNGETLLVQTVPERDYEGRDMRLFYRDLCEDRLPELYQLLWSRNYAQIRCTQECAEPVRKALLFLSLFTPVEILP